MSKTISFLVPGIRNYNWVKLYESIKESLSVDFEVIFCGPHPLPDELYKFTNVKYIKDFGSPARCQELASLVAEGFLITWLADDGICRKKAFDHCVSFYRNNYKSDKSCVVWKYTESNNEYPDDYYFVNYHQDLRVAYIPRDTLIFNGAIMTKTFLNQLGKLDCKFQSTSWAHTDLGIRARMYGGHISFFKETPLVDCYQEGPDGDHGPIQEAFADDKEVYQKKYNDPLWMIKPENFALTWDKSPHIWEKRFKKNA